MESSFPSSRSTSKPPILQFDVLKMLISCGYDTNHPLVNELLKKEQNQIIDNLLQCRIRCHSTCYLMGLPDPTGLLSSDQIYVPGWCSCHCRHNQQHDLNNQIDERKSDNPLIDNDFTSHSIVEVLVSRFPLHSSKAIKKFQLIGDCFRCSPNYHPLIHFFNPFGSFIPEESGVVIFGSNPLLNGQKMCPAVHDMSGDYDGDLYWVCADNRIVSQFKEDTISNEPSAVDKVETLNLYQNQEHVSHFELPSLIQSTILGDFSQSTDIQLPHCRYTQLLSKNNEDIKQLSDEDLLEALLWEGIGFSIRKHSNVSLGECDHGRVNKYLQVIGSHSGVAK